MQTLEALARQNPALVRQALAHLPRRTSVEGSLIAPGLYQGQAPPCGALLRQAGIDTIILCAEEWQPPKAVDPVCAAVLGYRPDQHPYPGVTLIYAPADDDFDQPPSAAVLGLASRAAGHAARRILQGGKVMSSCWAGKNRSGLVTAMILHGLTGLGGGDILAHMRKARPQALTNPQFRAAIEKIQPIRRARAV